MPSSNTFQRRRWLTHYAPLAFWTILILGLGSSLGAMNETSRFIRPLLEFLFPSTAPETLTVIHGLIRKLAHFVEYAVLGFLAARAFERFDRRYLVGLIFVMAVAVVDEAKQSLDPSRTSSPWDVLLDVAGGSAALVLNWLVARRRRPA